MKFPALLPMVIFLGLPLAAQTPNAPAPAAPAPAAAAGSYDFGDYKSSTLTTKAWQALTAKNYPAVMAYTGKCIDTFKAQAVAQQATLKAPAPKDSAFTYWALNDVGTCYFIQAKALEAQGNTKDALTDYQFLANNLSFTQCWDPQGWFWSPADAAKTSVAQLQLGAAK
jgi:hypothetical protein